MNSTSADDSSNGSRVIKNLLIVVKAKPLQIDFVIFGAKETFIYLWKAFIKASILKHLDLKSYIQIEINVLRYAIDRILN